MVEFLNDVDFNFILINLFIFFEQCISKYQSNFKSGYGILYRFLGFIANVKTKIFLTSIQSILYIHDISVSNERYFFFHEYLECIFDFSKRKETVLQQWGIKELKQVSFYISNEFVNNRENTDPQKINSKQYTIEKKIMPFVCKLINAFFCKREALSFQFKLIFFEFIQNDIYKEEKIEDVIIIQILYKSILQHCSIPYSNGLDDNGSYIKMVKSVLHSCISFITKLKNKKFFFELVKLLYQIINCISFHLFCSQRSFFFNRI